MKCKICGSEAESHGRDVLLGKHEVAFFRCAQCGFIQTQEPFWLAEAYARPITSSDVGYVGRNIAHANMVKAIILIMFNPAAQFADFGGGYGMFVRLMRDQGFDFLWDDKFCENLFARGLDLRRKREPLELVTAFEVFEHLPEPLQGLEEMLQLSDSVLFSTTLSAATPPRLREWDYYGLEHGQHVSFYSLRTLEWIAAKNGLHLLSWGGYLHLLTRRRIPLAKLKWQMALNRYSKFAITHLIKRQTLLWEDSKTAIEQANRPRPEQ